MMHSTPRATRATRATTKGQEDRSMASSMTRSESRMMSGKIRVAQANSAIGEASLEATSSKQHIKSQQGYVQQREQPVEQSTQQPVRPPLERSTAIHSQLSRRWIFAASCIVLISMLQTADAAAASSSASTSTSAATAVADGAGDDWVTTVALSLLFAFCTTLVGSFLAYLSYLDDIFVREYWREGTTVEADVVSSVILSSRQMERGTLTAPSQAANPKQPASDMTDQIRNGNHSHLVFDRCDVLHHITIEYSHNLDVDYKIRIRKKVQAYESDFYYPTIPTMNIQHDVTKTLMLPSGNNEEAIPQQVDTACASPIVRTKSNYRLLVDNFEDENRKIAVLVLPSHPQSGLPKNHVKRLNTLARRFLPLAFVGMNCVILAFCLSVASHAVEDHGGGLMKPLFGIFILLCALQIPFIAFMGHGAMEEMLRQDYWDSGELVPHAYDDSSLSSGSDAFLTGYPQNTASSSL